MDNNGVILLTQLITTLQRIVDQLADAEKERTRERFDQLKKEALEIQKKIDASL